jgi:anaerobic selenocysteine-containing dehydrogenase
VTDGIFTRLDPDPTHPTGAAICAKGRAAPELVYHKDRLKRPLRRTRPKGEADPAWEEISWDAAFDQIASAMRRIADQHGPEAVAFSQSSPSTTAIADSAAFVTRLMNAFGTPNLLTGMELCGWGRGFATRYVFGVGSVATNNGGAMADIAESGCLILWGYNPSFTRITHATATVAGLKRGMKLIVIDPRHAGLANKADVWLQVRPGTDGALALGLSNIMIERGWYDEAFVRTWSNGPLLVCSDTDRLLRTEDLASGGQGQFVAWDSGSNRAVSYDPAAGRYEGQAEQLALRGEYIVATKDGPTACRPVFDRYAALCRKYSPEVIEATCWIDPEQLEETARTIWHSRPVSYYAWSGHEHHANSTETARAMAMLYALTGSFDTAGGNVLFPSVPAGSITGENLPAARHRAPAIGFAERPLGPARWNQVSPRDFYRAVLEGVPYPVRGLIGFGSNLLLAHGDPARGRAALAALDFYAHADLFMTPTDDFLMTAPHDPYFPLVGQFGCGSREGWHTRESEPTICQ